MKQRITYLIKLYITLILIFLIQEGLFMLFNISFADGAPFSSSLAALIHGLKLDSVAACQESVFPLSVSD